MGDPIRDRHPIAASSGAVARWSSARRKLLAGAALCCAFGLGRMSAGGAQLATIDTPATRDATAVAASLDDLEAQLHLGQGWVNEQSEFARRHTEVSELACAAASGHAADMKRIAEVATRRRRHERAPPSDADSFEESGAMTVRALGLGGRHFARAALPVSSPDQLPH